MQAIDRIQVHAGAGIDSNNGRFPFDKLSGWVSIPRFNHATRQTFCQERSLSYVGNVCAHHGWLWNRTLSVNPELLPRWRRHGITRDRVHIVLLMLAYPAQAVIHARFTSKQQAFLDFVLAHYVQDGVEELDRSKLGTLINLRYGAISAAILGLDHRRTLATCLWASRSTCTLFRLLSLNSSGHIRATHTATGATNVPSASSAREDALET